MSDSPAQSYAIARKIIPKRLQPFFRGLRKRLSRPRALKEPYRSVFSYTQAHPVRQENLVRLCGLIEQRDVPGCIVECGVLDGGTAALMAYCMKDRQIHLFDSWEGLPEVTPEDGDGGRWAGQVVGSPKRVQAIMRELNIDQSRLHFHKGWFADTFPRAAIGQIALLHADGDFYESVKLTLETWEPKVSPGGFIQLDDYGIFIGCTKAVDEFLFERPHLKLEYVEGRARAYFIEIPSSR
jgi:O-methyltransferase